MDYKGFVQMFEDAEKEVRDSVSVSVKTEKALRKDVEKGDVRAVIKDSEQLEAIASGLLENSRRLRESIASFNYQAYFNSGEFAIQMLDACEGKGINTAGEFPVYEMFPYKVKIDAENQDVWLDRKKIQSMSPDVIATTIRAGLDRLDKVKFDASSFINELYGAYCSYNMKHQSKASAVVAIMNIYKEMVPMARFRKDYDQQAFAFDIARLYRNPEAMTKDGMRVVFASARGTQIRILDSEGRELFIGSVSFEKAE